MKYHYIPFTNRVVVYQYHQVDFEEFQNQNSESEIDPIKQKSKLLQLYHEICGQEKEENLTFSQLRGFILTSDPLNVDLIKRLNEAELDYWIQSQGVRVDESRKLLMFECGGRQHVKVKLINV